MTRYLLPACIPVLRPSWDKPWRICTGERYVQFVGTICRSLCLFRDDRSRWRLWQSGQHLGPVSRKRRFKGEGSRVFRSQLPSLQGNASDNGHDHSKVRRSGNLLYDPIRALAVFHSAGGSTVRSGHRMGSTMSFWTPSTNANIQVGWPRPRSEKPHRPSAWTRISWSHVSSEVSITSQFWPEEKLSRISE